MGLSAFRGYMECKYCNRLHEKWIVVVVAKLQAHYYMGGGFESGLRYNIGKILNVHVVRSHIRSLAFQ